jgi:hypothetical protein
MRSKDPGAWLSPLIGAGLPDELHGLEAHARTIRLDLSMEEEERAERASQPRPSRAGRPPPSTQRGKQTRERVEEAARQLLAQGVEERHLKKRIADALGVCTNCVRDYLPAFLEKLQQQHG